MQWISKPIAFYPDTLICEDWVDWSEQVLNQQHDSNYSTPRGFQDFIGSTNSNARTRAVELFRMGLLRGPLVNEQSGGRYVLPSGWDLVQHNQHVHTRLGYLAYCIGKAKRDNPDLPKTERAFNTLCTLFALQSGFQFGDNYILLATLFNYLLDKFTPSLPKNSRQWRRYLAAAMFCTLDCNDAEVSSMVIPYLAGQSINKLYIRFQNGSKLEVGPDELADKMDEEMSLSNLSQTKSSLYWIGELGDNELRGVYSKAILQGSALIRLFRDIERENISRGIENPFKVLLKPSSGDIDILKQIYSIVELYPAAKDHWSKLMRTLYDGIIEALHFIEHAAEPSHRVFYGHDIAETTIEDEELLLEVNNWDNEATPQSGDVIVLGEEGFVVQSVDQSNDHLAISVRKAKAANQ